MRACAYLQVWVCLRASVRGVCLCPCTLPSHGSLCEMHEGRVRALLEADGAAGRVDRRPHIVSVQVRLPSRERHAE